MKKSKEKLLRLQKVYKVFLAVVLMLTLVDVNLFVRAFVNITANNETEFNVDAVTTPTPGTPQGGLFYSDIRVNRQNFLTFFNIQGEEWAHHSLPHGTPRELDYNSGTGILELTRARQWEVGSTTLAPRIDMTSAFRMDAEVFLGQQVQVLGADGIGFAFHPNHTRDLGNSGGAMGIGGLPYAIGFQLDTFHNSAGDADDTIGNFAGLPLPVAERGNYHADPIWLQRGSYINPQHHPRLPHINQPGTMWRNNGSGEHAFGSFTFTDRYGRSRIHDPSVTVVETRVLDPGWQCTQWYCPSNEFLWFDSQENSTMEPVGVPGRNPEDFRRVGPRFNNYSPAGSTVPGGVGRVYIDRNPLDQESPHILGLVDYVSNPTGSGNPNRIFTTDDPALTSPTSQLWHGLVMEYTGDFDEDGELLPLENRRVMTVTFTNGNPASHTYGQPIIWRYSMFDRVQYQIDNYGISTFGFSFSASTGDSINQHLFRLVEFEYRALSGNLEALYRNVDNPYEFLPELERRQNIRSSADEWEVQFDFYGRYREGFYTVERLRYYCDVDDTETDPTSDDCGRPMFDEDFNRIPVWVEVDGYYEWNPPARDSGWFYVDYTVHYNVDVSVLENDAVMTPPGPVRHPRLAELFDRFTNEATVVAYANGTIEYYFRRAYGTINILKVDGDDNPITDTDDPFIFDVWRVLEPHEEIPAGARTRTMNATGQGIYFYHRLPNGQPVFDDALVPMYNDETGERIVERFFPHAPRYRQSQIRRPRQVVTGNVTLVHVETIATDEFGRASTSLQVVNRNAVAPFNDRVEPGYVQEVREVPGNFQAGTLPVGTYVVFETSAPAPFIVDPSPNVISFFPEMIDQVPNQLLGISGNFDAERFGGVSGQTITITDADARQNIQLPFTTGIGGFEGDFSLIPGLADFVSRAVTTTGELRFVNQVGEHIITVEKESGVDNAHLGVNVGSRLGAGFVYDVFRAEDIYSWGHGDTFQFRVPQVLNYWATSAQRSVYISEVDPATGAVTAMRTKTMSNQFADWPRTVEITRQLPGSTVMIEVDFIFTGPGAYLGALIQYRASFTADGIASYTVEASPIGNILPLLPELAPQFIYENNVPLDVNGIPVEPIGIITTGANGSGSLSGSPEDLPFGTYIVMERYAPSPWLLDSTPFPIVLAPSDCDSNDICEAIGVQQNDLRPPRPEVEVEDRNPDEIIVRPTPELPDTDLEIIITLPDGEPDDGICVDVPSSGEEVRIEVGADGTININAPPGVTPPGVVVNPDRSVTITIPDDWDLGCYDVRVIETDPETGLEGEDEDDFRIWSPQPEIFPNRPANPDFITVLPEFPNSDLYVRVTFTPESGLPDAVIRVVNGQFIYNLNDFPAGTVISDRNLDGSFTITTPHHPDGEGWAHGNDYALFVREYCPYSDRTGVDDDAFIIRYPRPEIRPDLPLNPDVIIVTPSIPDSELEVTVNLPDGDEIIIIIRPPGTEDGDGNVLPPFEVNRPDGPMDPDDERFPGISVNPDGEVIITIPDSWPNGEYETDVIERDPVTGEEGTDDDEFEIRVPQPEVEVEDINPEVIIVRPTPEIPDEDRELEIIITLPDEDQSSMHCPEGYVDGGEVVISIIGDGPPLVTDIPVGITPPTFDRDGDGNWIIIIPEDWPMGCYDVAVIERDIETDLEGRDEDDFLIWTPVPEIGPDHPINPEVIIVTPDLDDSELEIEILLPNPDGSCPDGTGDVIRIIIDRDGNYFSDVPAGVTPPIVRPDRDANGNWIIEVPGDWPEGCYGLWVEETDPESGNTGEWENDFIIREPNPEIEVDPVNPDLIIVRPTPEIPDSELEITITTPDGDEIVIIVTPDGDREITAPPGLEVERDPENGNITITVPEDWPNGDYDVIVIERDPDANPESDRSEGRDEGDYILINLQPEIEVDRDRNPGEIVVRPTPDIDMDTDLDIVVELPGGENVVIIVRPGEDPEVIVVDPDGYPVVNSPLIPEVEMNPDGSVTITVPDTWPDGDYDTSVVERIPEAAGPEFAVVPPGIDDDDFIIRDPQPEIDVENFNPEIIVVRPEFPDSDLEITITNPDGDEIIIIVTPDGDREITAPPGLEVERDPENGNITITVPEDWPNGDYDVRVDETCTDGRTGDNDNDFVLVELQPEIYPNQPVNPDYITVRPTPDVDAETGLVIIVTMPDDCAEDDLECQRDTITIVVRPPSMVRPELPEVEVLGPDGQPLDPNDPRYPDVVVNPDGSVTIDVPDGWGNGDYDLEVIENIPGTNVTGRDEDEFIIIDLAPEIEVENENPDVIIVRPTPDLPDIDTDLEVTITLPDADGNCPEEDGDTIVINIDADGEITIIGPDGEVMAEDDPLRPVVRPGVEDEAGNWIIDVPDTWPEGCYGATVIERVPGTNIEAEDDDDFIIDRPPVPPQPEVEIGTDEEDRDIIIVTPEEPDNELDIVITLPGEDGECPEDGEESQQVVITVRPPTEEDGDWMIDVVGPLDPENVSRDPETGVITIIIPDDWEDGCYNVRAVERDPDTGLEGDDDTDFDLPIVPPRPPQPEIEVDPVDPDVIIVRPEFPDNDLDITITLPDGGGEIVINVPGDGGGITITPPPGVAEPEVERGPDGEVIISVPPTWPDGEYEVGVVERDPDTGLEGDDDATFVMTPPTIITPRPPQPEIEIGTDEEGRDIIIVTPEEPDNELDIVITLPGEDGQCPEDGEENEQIIITVRPPAEDGGDWTIDVVGPLDPESVTRDPETGAINIIIPDEWEDGCYNIRAVERDPDTGLVGDEERDIELPYVPQPPVPRPPQPEIEVDPVDPDVIIVRPEFPDNDLEIIITLPEDGGEIVINVPGDGGDITITTPPGIEAPEVERGPDGEVIITVPPTWPEGEYEVGAVERDPETGLEGDDDATFVITPPTVTPPRPPQPEIEVDPENPDVIIVRPEFPDNDLEIIITLPEDGGEIVINVPGDGGEITITTPPGIEAPEVERGPDGEVIITVPPTWPEGEYEVGAVERDPETGLEGDDDATFVITRPEPVCPEGESMNEEGECESDETFYHVAPEGITPSLPTTGSTVADVAVIGVVLANAGIFTAIMKDKRESRK